MNIDLESPLQLVTDKLESWLQSLITMLPNLVVAVIVVILFFLLAKLVSNVAYRLLSKISQNEAVNNLLVTILNIGVIAAGFFIALGILNLTEAVTALLAGVGIVGLALGFAFQDIAANFVSGILIAVRQPFKVGDIIENGDYFGTVRDISLRVTTIATFQGLEVLIPNKNLFENPVVNYTRTKDRRVDLEVGVSYGDNLEKAKKLAIDVISRLDSIDRDREVTLFYTGFGDSSINFTVRFWAQSPKQLDYLQARSDAIIAIQKVFDENNIVIPFPIRTLDFGIKGGEKLSEMVIHHGNGKSAD